MNKPIINTTFQHLILKLQEILMLLVFKNQNIIVQYKTIFCNLWLNNNTISFETQY